MRGCHPTDHVLPFSFLFSLFSVEKNHLDWLRNLSKADLVGDNLDNVDLILAVGIHS